MEKCGLHGIPLTKYVMTRDGQHALLIDGFRHADAVMTAQREGSAGSLKTVEYLLTHAHSDHYTGLKPSWNYGKIYCSDVTARLIVHLIGIDPVWLEPLAMEKTTILPSGTQVTLVDANHCPGAVMFTIVLPDGQKILHTGDFRFAEWMSKCPVVRNFQGCDLLYLDTTYCDKKHRFPPQEKAVEFIASTIQKYLQEDCQCKEQDRHKFTGKYRRLYLISTYVIGKERIFKEIASKCNVPIYASERKSSVLASLEGILPKGLITNDPESTPVHLVPWNGFLGETWPFFRPNWTKAREYCDSLGAATAIGFIPTGWAHNMSKAFYPKYEEPENRSLGRDPLNMYLVPYSEHCNFDELLQFVSYIRPVKIIPTVGGQDEKSLRKILKNFSNLTDTTTAKARFINRISRNENDGLEEKGQLNNFSQCKDMGEDRVSARDVDSLNGCIAKNKALESEVACLPEGVATLIEVTGLKTLKEAEELLKLACGDIARAADMFFDGFWNRKRKLNHNLAASSYGSEVKTKVQFSTVLRKRSQPEDNCHRSQGIKRRAVQSSILSFLNEPLELSKNEKDVFAESDHQKKDDTVDLKKKEMSVCAKFEMGDTSSRNIRCHKDRSKIVAPDVVTRSLGEYHPIFDSCWNNDTPTPYLALARAFEAMESTKKRLKISDVLVNTFRTVLALCPEDLVYTAYLLMGKIAPDYEGIELNVGGATVSGAISEATGISRGRIRELYNEIGDLGDVASSCRRNQTTLVTPKYLSLRDLFNTLKSIALEKGQGSNSRRHQQILGMIRRCRESETKYLVRTLIQNLRVGANWRSVVPALAKAVKIHGIQKYKMNQILDQIRKHDTDISGLDNLSGDGELIRLIKEPLPSVPSKEMLDAAASSATAAFHCCPNLDLFIEALLYDDTDVDQVHKRCTITPGIPIKPMLGKITAGIADSVSQLNDDDFIAEYKYDGVRAQIHLIFNTPENKDRKAEETPTVKIFSRNLEDRTSSFPDVVNQILSAAKGGAKSCILDAEIVAVKRNCEYMSDCLKGNPSLEMGVNILEQKNKLDIGCHISGQTYLRPFQELAARPRGEVQSNEITIDVCIFVFDIMERDGESLLEEPLSIRRDALSKALPCMRQGYVQCTEGFMFRKDLPCPSSIDADDTQSTRMVAQVENALHDALHIGAEGLMLKSLSSTYEPSKRSSRWLKLKKDYCEGIVDSLDLVVIGAFHGSGRKAGWYSPFLLGVWDPESESFQSICRCMSGFSDDFYRNATERLKKTVVQKKPVFVDSLEKPDVWFNPSEVWEIRGADLTLSPVHRAAIGNILENPSRGIGLRFPRFIGIRDDKTIEDATSTATILEMYQKQQRGQILAARNNKEDDEE